MRSEENKITLEQLKMLKTYITADLGTFGGASKPRWSEFIR